MKMKTTVNYMTKYGEDGTVYRQTITVNMTRQQLDDINQSIEKAKVEKARQVKWHCMSWNLVEPIHEGENRLSISTFVLLYQILGWKSRPRIKEQHRNTILNVKIKED
jgi:hypothetical protein